MKSKKGFSIFLVLIFSSILIAIPVSQNDATQVDTPQVDTPYECEEDLIEIMFDKDSQVRLRNGSLFDFKSDALTGVDQILDKLDWHKWYRICDVAEDIVDSWSTNGERNTGKPVYNMNNIYRLQIPKGQKIWTISATLEELPGVILARPVPKPMELPVPPNYQSLQGYLDPASSTPTGVDAIYAWTQTGGTGTGVTVCDLEYSWNYSHADISKAAGSQINTNVVDPFSDNNHGTAVIGELVSDNNSWGTTGICYGSGLKTCGTYYGSPTPSWNVPGAMAVAIAALSAGDIILLEQQWAYTYGGNDYIPIEWWMNYSPSAQTNNGVYAAIVNAVSNGIHVVQAGGNGSVDTGALTWYGNSGAIIVGAGGALVSNDLQKLSFSSYGPRFDLQGWGENVFTTGYGSYYSAEGVNYYYTSTFNGTSSASPIVAGALACAEGYYLANVSSTPPTPAYMRTHLNTYGTAQITPPTGNIGPRPDLYAAITNFPPPQPNYDWGDAPDPTFPTLAASTGAYHLIVAGIQLGNTIDPEPDGQPTVNADGDDNDGNNDDDGVVFNSVLSPGSTVSVTVTASVLGILEGWIDFDGNGSWADTGEHIISNVVPAGPTVHNFTVPASSIIGSTYARFRFCTQGALTFFGQAPDGEVEDYKVDIVTEGTKWQQLPDLSTTGMDVDATLQPDSDPILLADDFLCTETGYITDIHIWGSWLNDYFPSYGPPEAVQFTFSIHSDIPAGVIEPWSMPGDVLWWKTWIPDPDDVEWINSEPEDWYNPYTGEWINDNHFWCFKYNWILDPSEYFLQQGTPEDPIIYWLDVQAMPMDPAPECRFGWKTSLNHWNDDAVWTIGNEPYNGPWEELRYPFGHEYELQSIDLAFAITTEEEPEELDFGDAPDPTYPTLLASGARHIIDYQIFMGFSIDAELDGQPDATATGDDNDGNDDEDGVIFTSPLYIGQLVNVDVTVSVNGFINAWIDFDIDGGWGEVNDQIFTDVSVAAGTNTLSFTVPASATLGTTFTRFRFDTAGGLTFTGLADDGEVEDYRVTIEEEVTYEYDFGDAPEGASAIAYPSTNTPGSFPTCITVGPSGYISHGPGPLMSYFGPSVDLELDGNAGGCPNCFPTYDDDECFQDGDAGLIIPEPFTINTTNTVVPCTGFVGTPLGTICQTATWGVDIDIDVQNFSTLDCFVNVLFDWNQNGYWLDDPGTKCFGTMTPEHVLINFLLPAGYIGPLSGLTPPPFTIGPNAGYFWSRFTISDTQVPAGEWEGSGEFAEGETEDYLILVDEELDFGDAPDPNYPTLLASNGARHILDGVTFLGLLIDAEPDGLQDPNALGDDNNNLADEDGIVFKQIMTGSPAQVIVTTSAPGYLQGWMDFNIDGDWTDLGEQIFTDVCIHFAGTVCLNYYVPDSTSTGYTFARFRFSTIGGLGITGQAPDGEVEDYGVEIVEDHYVKWSQLPCEELPGLHCTDGVEIMADDWRCNGGLVTDIHWWGNYEYDFVGNGINYFHLSIHDDDPTGTCLPVDTEIWGANVPFTSTNETNTGLTNSDGYIIYKYEHILSDPFIQTEGNFYWLDICAYSFTGDIVWRWQESSRSTAPILCSAAERTLLVPPWWQPIVWTGLTPYRYSDMAFEITSCPPSTPLNFTITKVGTNMTLQWDPDPCSIYYNVYSSTDPYAAFPGGWTLEAYHITTTTWNDPISGAGSKKFYRVTAEN